MRAFHLTLLLLIPISLVACGKKGALYLPDDTRQQKADSHLIGPIMAPTASTRSDIDHVPASPAGAPLSTPPPATPATSPNATPLSNPK